MGYWNNVVQTRISRRRALAATGATAAGAAFLAACGGGDSGGDSGTTAKKDGSGLITEPEDTTKTAKIGGVFKWYHTTEPNHLDGIAQGQSQLNRYNGMVYSSLVSNKMGYKQPSSFNEVIPNMATSWEFSPDRLTLTFKLRQGVKWQNRPPVNNRVFDSSDVVATWNRYIALTGNNKAANANSFNPNAPIMSVTAPDANTVVYKLKEPTSYILQRLANMVTGEAGTIQPREAGAGFDPRKDQIGTGGFMLDKWEPSVGLTYKRNPDYWDKEAAFIGTIEVPIIPQYPTGLAAFQAGNIHYFDTRPTDQVATKKQTPALSMYQRLISQNTVNTTIGFGWQPWGNLQKSPFLDVRVRQAMSHGIDRDTFIDTFHNVGVFEKEGLPVETYYYTSLGYMPGITLDPRDAKTFGPNAKYYTPPDVAEAKKLLSAAGFANGFEYPAHFVKAAPFGVTYQQETEVLDGWARDLGLKPVPTGIDYNIEYLTKFVVAQGKHEGILYRAGAVSSQDPVDYYVWRYWSKSGPTSGALGADSKGAGDLSGDPEVDSLIEKAKAEPDTKKQVTLLQDLQRHLAKMQYCISRPGNASGFDLAWPAFANYKVWQNDLRTGSANADQNHYYTAWIDETKAPIKKA
ncbi:MAG TPA: ABC transporter substrate-binding protein [Dehalococcoidia bacterium]|nr:ABC transporter substrate-binding protein [Dehalococcoidia bacterium]